MTHQYTKLADELDAVNDVCGSRSIREAARILRAAAGVDVAGLLDAADRYALAKADPAHWRAALESALRLVLAQRVPPGCVVVPVEPTEAMLEAAHNSDREYTLRNFGDIMTVMQGPYDHWCSMIAAAPQAKEQGK